jgi:hypothetical protein
MGMIQNQSSIQNPSFLVKTAFVHLSDDRLSSHLKGAVQREKTATLEVLEYLLEVERRKLYSTCSYSSLFEYVVQELGYSESQASERINSMRLLRSVPEVREKLESGELSITTASQIQRFIKNEKRFAGEDLTPEEKIKLVDLCSNQSKRDVERTLFAMQSDEAKIESAERTRWVSEDHVELKFLVSDGVVRKISEVRNLVGEAPLSRIFADALDAYLLVLKKKHHRAWTLQPDRGPEGNEHGEPEANSVPAKEGAVVAEAMEEIDPIPTDLVALPATWTQSLEEKKGKTSPSPGSRYVPAVFRRMVFARSNGQCEFVDQKTKNRCLSRYRLQIDHIFPFAKGGKTQPDNLRHLCANHNQRSAIEHFS